VTTTDEAGTRRDFLRTSGALLGSLLAGAAILAGTNASLAADDTIKIGVVLPTNPPGDVAGAKTAIDAMNLVVEHRNATGGVLGKKLEMVLQDSSGIAEKGVSAAERLSEEKNLAAVIGEWTSSVSLAIIEVMHRKHIPNIQVGSSSDDLTAKHYPEVFRLGLYDSQFVNDYFVPFFVDQGYKRIGISAESSAYPIGFIKALKEAIKRKKLDMQVEVQFHEPGATDLTPQLLALRRWGPDVVLNTAVSTPNMYLFTKQAWDVGIAPKIPIVAGWDYPTLPDYWKINGNKGTGLIYLTFEHPKAPVLTDLGKAFIEEFNKKYGYRPSFWAVLYGMAVDVVADAVQRAGTLDADAVIAELDKTNLASYLGRVTFTNEVSGPVFHQWTGQKGYMVQITKPYQQHDDTQIVWPANLATAKIVMPRAE
jgi:branched-chain amino acid transport system substrate-binding protein